MEVVMEVLIALLPKLETLLTREYKLQRGLADKIQSLKSELKYMHGELSEPQMTDNTVKIWTKKVRELSYDIEDVIDKFTVHVEVNSWEHGIKGLFDRCLGLFTRATIRRQIATDIEKIHKLVTEEAQRHDRYRSTNANQQNVVQDIDPRVPGMYEHSRNLVAISVRKEELSSLLMEQEGTSKRQLKLISIWGVGGLGKSTLAKVTYDQLRHKFDCGAFVSVSHKPNLNRTLAHILREVSEGSYPSNETWEAQELINKIRQALSDKRYLIIIDDIWDTTDWTYIQSAFLDLENNCGSRIITTTRIHSVAKSCCSDIDGTIYALKPLSRDDSKQLFYKRVFGSEGSCHPELKETSEKILKKCGGVPLAIIHIASLLANKPRNISEWNNVHNSIGSGLEEGMENMRQILSISYNALPPELKPCLLYLSVFPEDYSIPIDQLVRRWIAEGFVHGKRDDSDLHEIGHKYLNKLIKRSMIQLEATYASIRVHDMILDLITSLSTKENFVTTFDGHQQHADHSKKVRRLSLQNNEQEHNLPHATLNSPHLRSVIVFPGATNLMPPLSNLPVLRVLDVENCHDLENHRITGVGKLFHLRYLGLRDTNITKLPRQLGNLHCLHTLDLSQTSITELPSSTVHLKQLVRLYIEDSVKLPKGIGKLNLLRELSSVGVSSSPNIVTELGNLTELRIIHITLDSGTGTWCKSYEKPLLDSMFKLQKIQKLHIRSFGVPTDFIADFGWFPQHLNDFLGSIPRLPCWMNSSLSKLHQINMSLNILRQEDLQNLGLIPFLYVLHLNIGKIESTEERLVIGTDSSQFQCLYDLSFDSLYAMGLMFVQGALPNLGSLNIMLRARETKDLYGDFNIGLENLCSVREVSVKIGCTGCRRCEVDSAEADIRRAIVNNPNNPTFDITRCFEYELDEVQHLESGETIEEEEQTMPERVGPWGGEGKRNHDIVVAPWRLVSVKVTSGQVVDGIGFSYLDKHGKQYTTPLWGGHGGNVHMIHLAPSEFVTEVSGTCGPFFRFPNVVTSLQLVTNLQSHGPFGEPKGTKFRTRVKQNGSIVGFFGQSTIYLDAIGVYVRP